MNADSRTSTVRSSQRSTSLVAGVLYLVTFISIPTLALYRPVKRANYILGAGPDTAAIVGGLLEIIVALAGIGTAVVLFPVLKKQNERFALGLVVSRVLEASTILLGVAFLLSIVTLRKDAAGVDALPISHTLVAMYDRIFLLGQSFMPAITDLLLGLLLYQSRLVPRRFPGSVSSVHPFSSSATSPYCSVSSVNTAPWQGYSHFLSHYSSFRWASG